MPAVKKQSISIGALERSEEHLPGVFDVIADFDCKATSVTSAQSK